MTARSFALAGCLMLAAAVPAEPCSILAPVSPTEIVEKAEAIVRVRVDGYEVEPADPAVRTTGMPDSRVRFVILETLKGNATGKLILPGYVGDTDDFNDVPVPYTFVRRNGRRGSCFANEYRAGGEYLLMLKRNPRGEHTVNWYALGPVNEQLRGDNDRWLAWVRKQIQ